MRKLFTIICLVASLFFFYPTHAQENKVSEKIPQVLFYHLKDTIHGGTVEILEKIFLKAQKEGMGTVLIQLDTPGGLLDATEDIVKLLLNAEIPVIVYVAPSGARAGSAGTFITMAAHIAAMAPGTYIGAAHPVSIFGGGKEGNEEQRIMKAKIESVTISFIESIANQRGRNKEWAKKAVLESNSITEDVALKENVIDVVAKNQESLLEEIHGKTVKLLDQEITLDTKGASVVIYKPSLKLKFLNTIASPTLIYLLILVIIAGIYLEVNHPGIIIPGVVAGLSLILVLIATRTLPINALGILLIVAALILLVAEIYVTSYGFLTVAAIACFFMGSLFLFDSQKADVTVPLPYIIGSSSALAAIALVVGFFIMRSFRRPQVAGRERIIGMQGQTEEAIVPGKVSKVYLNSEYWNVVSDERIEKGERYEVVFIDGLTLNIKKKEG